MSLLRFILSIVCLAGVIFGVLIQNTYVICGFPFLCLSIYKDMALDINGATVKELLYKFK